MNSTTTVTTITNSSGAILRVTVIHREPYHWRLLVLGLLAAALIAWGLRLIFWQKDSN